MHILCSSSYCHCCLRCCVCMVSFPLISAMALLSYWLRTWTEIRIVVITTEALLSAQFLAKYLQVTRQILHQYWFSLMTYSLVSRKIPVVLTAHTLCSVVDRYCKMGSTVYRSAHLISQKSIWSCWSFCTVNFTDGQTSAKNTVLMLCTAGFSVVKLFEQWN